MGEKEIASINPWMHFSIDDIINSFMWWFIKR